MCLKLHGMVKVRNKSVATVCGDGAVIMRDLAVLDLLFPSIFSEYSVICTIPSKSTLITDWRTQLTLTECRRADTCSTEEKMVKESTFLTVHLFSEFQNIRHGGNFRCEALADRMTSSVLSEQFQIPAVYARKKTWLILRKDHGLR